MKKALLIAPMSSVHERFNIANFIALEANGFDVSVVANFSLCDHDKQYKKALEEKGIKVYDLPFQRASLLKNLKMIPNIKKILKVGGFDIVHTHTETGGILTRFSMSADKNAKYFYTPHGMSFYKGSSLKSQLIYRSIERFICGKMDKVFCINEEEYITVKAWKKGNEVFVHGIGLDLDAVKNAADKDFAIREEFGIAEDERVVLSVGELNDNKDHTTCIKALAKLNADATYIVCGEGDKREDLIKLAEKRGVKLVLTGYRYDVKSFYRVADLFVFPSHHEGLAVSMLEAMAAGLPIVCSRIRGNTDIITDGEGGYLCTIEDIDDFADRIDVYLSDETKRRTSGEINRKNAEQYSLGFVIEELKEIYKTR